MLVLLSRPKNIAAAISGSPPGSVMWCAHSGGFAYRRWQSARAGCQLHCRRDARTCRQTKSLPMINCKRFRTRASMQRRKPQSIMRKQWPPRRNLCGKSKRQKRIGENPPCHTVARRGTERAAAVVRDGPRSRLVICSPAGEHRKKPLYFHGNRGNSVGTARQKTNDLCSGQFVALISVRSIRIL